MAEEKLRFPMRGIKEEMFAGFVRNLPKTVKEFLTEAVTIEKTLEMHRRQFNRSSSTVNYSEAHALSTNDLHETIRAIVREELRKLLPSLQPQVDSIIVIVHEEVPVYIIQRLESVLQAIGRSVAAREEPGRLFNANQAYATAACAAGPSTSSEEAAAEAIEVPTWRVNPIASLYSMEGTENLDDEVFRKRHAKLEANEKRRKRWDLQLLREQQHTERLRRRMERRAEKPSTCPPTFCGDLKQIHFVEVVDEIPVQAFGQPIPELQPREFQLPWGKRHGETAKKPKGPWR
nr:uncharacterized protein LOC119177974 [Rhipicephalus microplus]